MAVLKFLAIFVPVAAGAGLALLMSGGTPPAVHEMMFGLALALLIALVEWVGWLLWRCLAGCCGRRQSSASTSA